MTTIRLSFGFYPKPLRLTSGPVTVEPLPDLDEIVAAMEGSDGTEGNWIYAPPQQVHTFGGIRTMPYPSRVFGLPKTHIMTHQAADSDDHLTFHLWALSFLTGMRLTATEAGFLDATPLQPGALVDFVLLGDSLEKGVALAEAFWTANRADPRRSQLFAAAVHALFLGQSPRNLQFESFMFLYTAFDACFALAESLFAPANRPSHAKRVVWMCNLFGMATPPWADPIATAAPEVAVIRNATFHEALFMDQPLGFALHGVGTNRNLMLEMEALICRLLVALLGKPKAEYVQSRLDTRSRIGLDLS